MNEEISGVTLTDNGKEIAKLCPVTYVHFDYAREHEQDPGYESSDKDSVCYILFSVIKTLFFVYKIYAKQF